MVVLCWYLGVQYVDSIEEFPEEKWDFILSVNLTALFFTTKYALPGMRERGACVH